MKMMLEVDVTPMVVRGIKGYKVALPGKASGFVPENLITLPSEETKEKPKRKKKG